jgi:hypothetical protein
VAVDTNYATLPELKAWRTAGDRTDRDDLMTLSLGAASRAIDKFCGRRFWLDATATARIFNGRDNIVVDADGGRLFVDDIGDLDGLLVEQGSASSSWSDLTSGIETSPLNATVDGLAVEGLLYASGWTLSPYTRVRVTARWGWPVVPDDVRMACLLIASALYDRRNSPQGLAGQGDWGSIRVARVDPHAESLLLPYRRIPVG